MIEVCELVKRYGSKTAVGGLDFTVRPGVVTGFLGPNGAGKPVTELRRSFPRWGATTARGGTAKQASGYTAGARQGLQRVPGGR